jgi:hypothetical protein
MAGPLLVLFVQREAEARHGRVAVRAQDGRGGAVIYQVFHWANFTLAFLLELCALLKPGY